MSNGIPDGSKVPRLPDNVDARAAVEEWVAGGVDAMLWGNEMDFGGADLSGIQFFETWAMESDFRRSTLVGTDFAGGHLYRTNFSGVDMRGAVLPNADATEADFSGANLSGANLRSFEAPQSRFRATVLRDSEIGGSLARADLRGADLSAVRFMRLSLRAAVLCDVVAAGARGTVIGPFLADVDGEERTIGGAEAERWFATRGAEVEVLDVDGLR